MKSILATFIFLFLAVFGFGQNANVLVGTNGEVVSPTNFWSANVTNAKSGLGLGSAATNPASAFQPSSSVLSNIASSNGSVLTNLNITNTIGIVSLIQGGTGATNASDARSNLGLGTSSTNPSSAFQPSSATLSNLASGNGVNITNLQASNIVGSIASSNIPAFNFTNISGTLTIAKGGTSATNASSARQNLGSTTIGDAIFTATNAAFVRNEIGATTVGSGIFTLTNPSAITFLRINADNSVSAIGASDFRASIGLGSSATNPSSAFQPANVVLSNLANSNGVDLTNITISNLIGVLTTNGNAFGLTNFPTSLLRTNGNGAGLTNLTAANITGTVALATNVSGTIAISNGGTGATNAATARTNLGLSATNNIFNSLSVGTSITNLSTNDSSAFGRQHYVVGGSENSFAAGFSLILSNAGVGAGGSIVLGGLANMTNQGAFLFNGVEQGGTVASSRGDYTFAVNASNGIFLNGPLKFEDVQGAATDTGILQISAGGTISRVMTNKSTATPAFFGWSGFSNTAFSAAEVRTNLGLAWSALTNSNAGTSLVSVNTNGQVVSPTNFWQVAPIQTLVQDLTAIVTSQTNNATNARNVYIYSLATNVSGISNTIILPTNTSTFNGDEVCVVHKGTTNTTTVVRQDGSTNNLITLNRFDEAVKFIRELGQWDFYHNISFVEPIQFSGTNTSVNAAVSRTNLGLAINNTNSVELGVVHVGGKLEIGSASQIEIQESAGIVFNGDNYITNCPPIYFSSGFPVGDSAGITRTNLNIPLEALTRTNNATFQEAIFSTNAAPTNAGNFGDHAAWMGVSIVTNGVTNVFRIPLYK